MSEVDDAAAVDTSDQASKDQDAPKKRVRHKKKLLYKKIRSQMEFYFSDANISKDRFLGDLVKIDPYVPVDTFLKFNKISELTQNSQNIARALKLSTTLELSEDRTKVKRKTPFVPYDADARTVYVESIPATASREWLEAVFSDYGKVAYISLPTFKKTQKIKGYAFVEYERPDQAQKCLVAFTKMGCKLPTTMPPEELSTVKLFSAEEPLEDKPPRKRFLEKDDFFEPPKKKKKTKERKKHFEMKTDSEQESDAEKKSHTPIKENRKNGASPKKEEKLTGLESKDTSVEEGKLTDAESKSEMTSQDEGIEGEIKKKKKKTRKRLSKRESRLKKYLGKYKAPKDALWSLQLLSKAEWKYLRNQYLNIQRKNMGELKKKLRAAKQSQNYMEFDYTAIAGPSTDMDTGHGDHTRGRTKEQAPVERTPGVFVKTQLPEPCTDVRATRRLFRSNVRVQNVDAKEGRTEVILRFDSAESASIFCGGEAGGAGEVLAGAEEGAQWERAAAALALGKRPRGRERLLARAARAAPAPAPPAAPADPQPTATHIRFDD